MPSFVSSIGNYAFIAFSSLSQTSITSLIETTNLDIPQNVKNNKILARSS